MKRLLLPLAIILFAVGVSAETRLLCKEDLRWGTSSEEIAAGTCNDINASYIPLTTGSNVETQLGLKAPLASPTFTGTVTIPTPFTLGATSVTATGTELNYVGGVTSALQTQLNAKAPLASPTFTGTVTIPTPFTLGAVSVTPTGTELNYVDGVTSAIQTQLDSKINTTATLTDVSDGVLTNPLTFNDDVYAKFGTDNDFTLRYKSADGTLEIALADTSVMCTFSNTGGLTCTGEATFTQYNSSGSDNTFGMNLCNTADPSGAYLEGGLIWCNSTDNTFKFRSPDNTATNTMGLLVAAPTTAADICTPGMFSNDADYHYECVAANTWRRVGHAAW